MLMVSKQFSPMPIINGSYILNKRVKFNKLNSFKLDTVNTVIEFAFNMTFGLKGEHRQSRSGGSIIRESHEIFANTFQGKLSEFAVANLFYKHKGYKEPDLSTHGLGTWEDADFKLGNNAIAVKSTKFYGNLILLESKDWDSKGIYLQSVNEPRNYSHIILVRIKPDIEEVLRELRKESKEKISLSRLKSSLTAQDWSYDIPGYITNADLISVIDKGFVIPKGAFLNHSVKMDAENIYVQAGDLRPVSMLLTELDD